MEIMGLKSAIVISIKSLNKFVKLLIYDLIFNTHKLLNGYRCTQIV
jgi:hypothetical protein